MVQVHKTWTEIKESTHTAALTHFTIRKQKAHNTTTTRAQTSFG